MIKSPAEMELMAQSGRLLASVFSFLDGQPLAGQTTMRINDLVEDFIVDQLGARPASKGQYGYGYVLNCSRNEVVCHGVPSTQEVLRDGDIVNFDITLEKNGYIADSSKTYLIGAVAPAARRLVGHTPDGGRPRRGQDAGGGRKLKLVGMATAQHPLAGLGPNVQRPARDLLRGR